MDLWEKSLDEGYEVPVILDDYDRRYAQWSPDGAQLAYTRSRLNGTEQQLMIWSRSNHSEEPLTGWGKTDALVYDWSPNGKTLLLSQVLPGKLQEIWEIPLAAAPHAENAARQIAADPSLALWQPHYSPNGKWIVFEAVSNAPTVATSALYVVSAGGGSWRRVTAGTVWDDKPRWSPDGKTIYFVSSGGGFFFNVWGIHFDPAKGEPLGKPFRISAFEKPSLMIPRSIPSVAMSVSQDKLLLTMSESSGCLWVLANIDR